MEINMPWNNISHLQEKHDRISGGAVYRNSADAAKNEKAHPAVYLQGHPSVHEHY